MPEWLSVKNYVAPTRFFNGRRHLRRYRRQSDNIKLGRYQTSYSVWTSPTDGRISLYWVHIYMWCITCYASINIRKGILLIITVMLWYSYLPPGSPFLPLSRHNVNRIGGYMCYMYVYMRPLKCRFTLFKYIHAYSKSSLNRPTMRPTTLNWPFMEMVSLESYNIITLVLYGWSFGTQIKWSI